MADKIIRANPRKGQPRDILSAEQKQAVITAYYAGEKYRVIAERFGVSDSAISGLLGRRGLTFNRRSISDDDLEVVRKFSADQRKVRAAEPLPIGNFESTYRRLTANDHAFDLITPESAYWVGMLMADGAVNPGGYNGVVLNLQAADRGHVMTFRDFLQSTYAITDVAPKTFATSLNGGGIIRSSGHARTAVGSRRLPLALAAYGLTRNKSLTAKALLVEMHPDFWRGVIDGDGTIKPTGPKGSIRLVGSEAMMNQFAEFCCAIYPRAEPRVVKRHSIFTASVSGKSAALLAYCMYMNGGPALLRKKERAMHFLNWHGLHV